MCPYLCLPHMCVVGYEVCHRPTFSLIGLHSIVCKCKLFYFNQYNVRIYIEDPQFCGHVLFYTLFP
jgi:hypothetical protein